MKTIPIGENNYCLNFLNVHLPHRDVMSFHIILKGLMKIINISKRPSEGVRDSIKTSAHDQQGKTFKFFKKYREMRGKCLTSVMSVILKSSASNLSPNKCCKLTCLSVQALQVRTKVYIL